MVRLPQPEGVLVVLVCTYRSQNKELNILVVYVLCFYVVLEDSDVKLNLKLSFNSSMLRDGVNFTSWRVFIGLSCLKYSKWNLHQCHKEFLHVFSGLHNGWMEFIKVYLYKIWHEYIISVTITMHTQVKFNTHYCKTKYTLVLLHKTFSPTTLVAY